jgi:Fic family protein
MVQLPYLQPFDDVNKRVSRLAANIPFIKGNLSPLSFADVPRQTYTEAVLGVYEPTKIELISLHEGNFARYRIRPSEFAAWRQVWEPS